MHRGRTYPYHPNYWATECIFWPGFVPWKMVSSVTRVNTAPWDKIVVGSVGVSDVGICVPDSTQISWHWSLVPPNLATDLVLSVEMISFLGVNYCRWKLKLSLGIVEVADAWWYQPYPSFTSGFISGSCTDVNNPDGSGNAVWIQCSCATYAEGGSPWSD